jgi:oligopeptide transport system substrate-binding protein
LPHPEKSRRSEIHAALVVPVPPRPRPSAWRLPGDLREQRRADNEVVLSLGGDPKTLDPGKIVDTISNRATMALIRGLTILDTEARPQPDLAERWEVSADGLTYDFYLRESRWTNGDPVTADDFVYAWTQRVLEPAFASEYAYMHFIIDGAQDYFERRVTDAPAELASVGVEAVGPRHLRIRLVAPAPYFPQLLAHQIFFPFTPTDRANPNWATRAESYVGNGPFRLTAFRPGDRLVAEPHEGYWNAANVAMRRLTFRFIEEESTERIALETGEVDGTYLAPRADLDALRDSGMLRITPEIGTYFLNFNVTRPELADARVRKALTLAIDRESITRNVARAGEQPAFAFVPPMLYDRMAEPLFPDAQFDEARRLLAEAGFPGGEGFPKLTYLYNTLELHRSIAQVLQETWKRELGIEIALENQEFRVVIENRNQGNFQIARNGWVADYADPVNFLEILLSYSGNNNSHWHDKTYDAMLEGARLEVDPVRRMDALREAERYMMDRWPVAPIFYYTHPYLCAPGLQGYDVTPMTPSTLLLCVGNRGGPAQSGRTRTRKLLRRDKPSPFRRDPWVF